MNKCDNTNHTTPKCINVNVKAMAYERARPKTKLSEFTDDIGIVTADQFAREIELLRQWFLYLFENQGRPSTPGGNIFGDDISSGASVRRRINCENVLHRSWHLNLGFNGGDIFFKGKGK